MVLGGKRAVVTGATRGIGRAIAERLAAEGADVTATGTKRGIDPPANCRHCVADFSDPADLARFADHVAKLEPDILVNNAGINKIGPFGAISLSDFNQIQQVNLAAPFRLCQSVLPAMTRRGWGRIVNIGSVWSKVGKELRGSYSASKFALAGMTAALAAEVARNGILVNCVSPGPIETEMTRTVLDKTMIDDLVRTIPAGRLGRPEEVAALVAWLVGPENTFVVGQNIVIDGGMIRV